MRGDLAGDYEGFAAPAEREDYWQFTQGPLFGAHVPGNTMLVSKPTAGGAASRTPAQHGA
jgi:hypothetical protein